MTLKVMKSNIRPSQPRPTDEQILALQHELHMRTIDTFRQILSTPNIDEKLITTLNKALLYLINAVVPVETNVHTEPLNTDDKLG